MPLTVQNVYGLLLRSKLLGLDDAKSVYQRWQKEAKTHADDLERFRRWLIGHHYLTEYQVGLLCRGRRVRGWSELATTSRRATPWKRNWLRSGPTPSALKRSAWKTTCSN